MPEPVLQDADDLVHWDRGEVAKDDEPFEGAAVVGHDAKRAAVHNAAGHSLGFFFFGGGGEWREVVG